MLIQPKAQPPIARIRWDDVIAASALAGAATFAGVEWMFWGPVWSTQCVLTLKTIANLVGGWFQSDADRYVRWLNQDWVREAKFMAAIALPTGAACWTGLSLATPKSPEIHGRGRLLQRGKAAEKAAAAMSIEKAKISGEEIRIHPAMSMAYHQVMQSILLMAAQGGGKTQILWRILLPLMKRNYKLVVGDFTKGDFTTSLPRIDRLFALGDARSSVWAVWRDVKSLPDAESFAVGVIPESDDPMWSNAARGNLIAILLKLINEQGENWRWRDLGKLLWLPIDDLKKIAMQHYPPAVSAVADAESKTSQSILINLHAFLAPLYRFCEEWSEPGEDFKTADGGTKPREFSWVDWLNDEDHRDRIIVLQSNAKDKTACAALNRAMLEVQVNHMASLEFDENKRRIGYVMDEVPQMGRVERMETILATCRSKGAFVLLAFQDIAQIRQIYREGEDDKWLAMLGVRIFGQVKGGASQDFVLKQIGKKEVHVPSTTITQTAGGSSTSTTYQRLETDVLAAHELELLGPQKSGVKAIVLGHGVDVMELEWDYFTPPKKRPAKVPLQAKKRLSDAMASAPDLAVSGAAGDDPEPEIGTPEQKEHAPAEQSARPAIDTDDLMLLPLPEPTKTPEIDTDSDPAAALEDIAKDQITETVAEAIDVSPDGLSSLLKIVETMDDAGGFCQAEIPVVVTGRKKSRRRKSVQDEAETTS